KSAPARVGRAEALLALGRNDEALEEYRKVSPQTPETQAAISRLTVLAILNQPEERRRWSEVERGLAEAEKAAPESVELAIARAMLESARGRDDHAAEALRKALGREPERAALWAALAALAERRGKPGDGLAVVDEAGKRLGDRVEPRLVRVLYWSQRGGN